VPTSEELYTLEIPDDDTPKNWTTIPFAATEINRRISGHRMRDCFEVFASKHGDRTFKRALFLNRTDFWLEQRLYFDLNLFTSAVAIHERHLPLPEFNARYSNANASAVIGGKNGKGQAGVWFNALSQNAKLAVWEPDLEIAQETWLARHGKMLSETVVRPREVFKLPIERTQFSESGEMPDGPFDLVINYMGGQSITHPDRIFRAICRQMAPDGLMLNFDYVGPHRYQYSTELWERVTVINEQLPESARHRLIYPRLSEMLERDPTDAVHSELTLETMKRYFTLHDLRPAGGAIAHPILSQNPKVFGFVRDFDKVAADVMAADWDYLREHPESTFLAYWTAQPNHAALDNREQLVEFTREEDRREETAEKNGGCYYPQTQLHRVLYPHDAWRSTMNGLKGKVRDFLRRGD
jgi:hypothetical protein